MQFHPGEFDLTYTFCFGRCPRSFNCPVWHLRHCFDTLRSRASCPPLAKNMFGTAVFLFFNCTCWYGGVCVFFDCLHRCPSALETHLELQLCRYLLRVVLMPFQKPFQRPSITTTYLLNQTFSTMGLSICAVLTLLPPEVIIGNKPACGFDRVIYLCHQS